MLLERINHDKQKIQNDMLKYANKEMKMGEKNGNEGKININTHLEGCREDGANVNKVICK